ncbi:hypothetical protein C8Q76DRAFT_723026 [Earliella scabrosa]|nr:hypothetical protein C8Q76DRAFT_723026 [Earliella scabrosa]
MIREEYDALWEEILSRMEAHENGKPVHGMVVIGQPGIGKSLFVPYAYGLALQLGIPTLYCPSPECYWIADDNGFREIFVNGHQSYYPTRDMLIFVDTIKPPEQLSSPGLNEGFLVQVTSPEDGWKDCAKERDADAWVMTTWSREEISSLQQLHESVNRAPWTQNPWFTPLELYDLLGPSPRSCLRSAYQRMKPQTGAALNAHLLRGPLSQELDPRYLFADPLAFLEALDSSATTSLKQRPGFHEFFFATGRVNPRRVLPIPVLNYEIPTQFLRLCLAMHYRKMLRLFGTMSSFARVTARLFKPLALDLLVEAENGLECTLDDSTTFRLGPGLTVHPDLLDPARFTPTTTAAFKPTDNHIYVVSEDHRSIDAFVVTEDMKRVTLLEMTGADRRDLKSRGIQGVIQMFGEAAVGINWSVVFVTPEQHGQKIAMGGHPLKAVRCPPPCYEFPPGCVDMQATRVEPNKRALEWTSAEGEDQPAVKRQNTDMRP